MMKETGLFDHAKFITPARFDAVCKALFKSIVQQQDIPHRISQPATDPLEQMTAFAVATAPGKPDSAKQQHRLDTLLQ
jgi:hypothetical protein